VKKEYKNVIKVVVGIYIFAASLSFSFFYLDSKNFRPQLYNIADRDTYVDSAFPSENNAEQSWAWVGSYITSEYCEAYFHFTLNNKPTEYNKIELSLSILSQITPTEFSIILVDNSWQEDTLTWNNKPAHQEIIKNFTIGSEEFYIIDLTEFLRDKDEISFCVNLTNSTIERYVSLNSREGSVYEVDAPRIIWSFEANYNPLYLIGIVLIYVLLIISLSVVITKITKARVLKKDPLA